MICNRKMEELIEQHGKKLTDLEWDGNNLEEFNQPILIEQVNY